MSNELKPCPFCGGEAKLATICECFYVKCVKCGACGSAGKRNDKPDFAIKSWNRRTQ